MKYIRLRRSNHHYLFMKQIKCQIWRRIVHQQISEHCVVANMCFDLLTKNHKLSLVSLAVWLTLVKPIMDILFHFFVMVICHSVLCIAFQNSQCIVFFCLAKLIAWLLRCDVLVIALSVFCESSRLTTWHFGANLGPLSVSSSCVIVCISTILWAIIAFRGETGNEINFGHPDMKKHFYEELVQ